MALSVVILSFNVKDLLEDAISSVYKTYKHIKLQIIVVDNASKDKSAQMVKKKFPKVELIESKKNLGFAKGNNLARRKVVGDVVLFLNPDTKVKGKAISKCLRILKNKKKVGAVTCKVLLPNGRLDYSCHRGLPTPWNAFCYFTGLSRKFPKSKFFSGYSATYLDTNKSHYIDCISGTFLMVRKKLLDKIGWWDEDFWWNGEDIELCFQIKKRGYKIWYEPSEEIIHFKGSSSGLWSTGKTKVTQSVKKKAAESASNSMKTFVKKHSNELSPWPLSLIIKLGIFLLETTRLSKINKGLLYKE